jgi:glutathione S-transferase
MQLIGLFDSPYVRRVAISLRLMGIAFEHRPLSVFRSYDEFARINPVVKAPSLVCDDGEVLMDSTLILEYAENSPAARRSLMPSDRTRHQHALRLIGLTLAACEKSVQIVYERSLRPPEKQHEPWIARVRGQLQAAYDALESELQRESLAVTSMAISQAGVTAAVTWQFTRALQPGIIDVDRYPALQAHSQQAEQLPEFIATPPI